MLHLKLNISHQELTGCFNQDYTLQFPYEGVNGIYFRYHVCLFAQCCLTLFGFLSNHPGTLPVPGSPQNEAALYPVSLATFPQGNSAFYLMIIVCWVGKIIKLMEKIGWKVKIKVSLPYIARIPSEWLDNGKRLLFIARCKVSLRIFITPPLLFRYKSNRSW